MEKIKAVFPPPRPESLTHDLTESVVENFRYQEALYSLHNAWTKKFGVVYEVCNYDSVLRWLFHRAGKLASPNY